MRSRSIYGGSLEVQFTGSDIKMDPRTRVLSLIGVSSNGDGRLILPVAAPTGGFFYITGGDIDILEGETVVGNSSGGVIAFSTKTGWVLRSPADSSTTNLTGLVQERSLVVEINPTVQHSISFNLIEYLISIDSPVVWPENSHVKWNIKVILPANKVLKAFSFSYAESTLDGTPYTGKDDPKSFAFRVGEPGSYLVNGIEVEIFVHQTPTILLTNYGYILGGGGSGTEGDPVGYQGQGSSAILADLPMTIDNRGWILAGGGGGSVPVGDTGIACSGQGYSRGEPFIGENYPGSGSTFLTKAGFTPEGTIDYIGWAYIKNDIYNDNAYIHCAHGGAWGCPGQSIGGARGGQPGLLVSKAENVTWLAVGVAQGLCRNLVDNIWELYLALPETYVNSSMEPLDPSATPVDLGELLPYYGYSSTTRSQVIVHVQNGCLFANPSDVRVLFYDPDQYLSLGPPLYGRAFRELRAPQLSHTPVLSTGSAHHPMTNISINVDIGCRIIGHGASAVREGPHPNGGDAIVAQHDITVNNKGEIIGGGGAGASLTEDRLSGFPGYSYTGGSGAGLPNSTPSSPSSINGGEILPYLSTPANGEKDDDGNIIGGSGGEYGRNGNYPEVTPPLPEGVTGWIIQEPSLAGWAVKEEGGISTILGNGLFIGRSV